MPTLRPRLLVLAALVLLGAPACAAAQAVPPLPDPAGPPDTLPTKTAPPATAPNPEPPAPTPPAAPPPAARDPAAVAGLEALAAAAHFQRGDHPLSRPTSLHGSFYVGIRDKDGTLIKGSAERWYTTSPERLLTSRTESVTGSRSTIGFDGTRAWFRDDATGRVTVYTDAPETFEVDLDQLHEQIRLTHLLLDAAVLDALIPRLHAVRATTRGQVSDPDGDAHAVQHVTARVADDLYPPPPGSPPDPGAPAELELDFAIDADSGALWALGVTAIGRADVAPLDLRFAFHGATRSGLNVPGNIKVFRAGEKLESVNLGLDEDKDGHRLFDLDVPIDPAMFAVPTTSKR